MTNNQIIFEESQKLAEAGIIEYTGRVFKAINAEGQEVEVKETEEIHTFADWKSRGYFVNKGEKAIARFTIWNFTTKPSKKTKAAREAAGKDTEAEDPRYYMKEACFFKKSQTSAAVKMLPAVV